MASTSSLRTHICRLSTDEDISAYLMTSSRTQDRPHNNEDARSMGEDMVPAATSYTAPEALDGEFQRLYLVSYLVLFQVFRAAELHSLSHSTYGVISSMFGQSGPCSMNDPVGTLYHGQNGLSPLDFVAPGGCNDCYHSQKETSIIDELSFNKVLICPRHLMIDPSVERRRRHNVSTRELMYQ